MDLNLLPLLRALLEHRNVSEAAKAVGVSPAAMDHALKQCRRALADPLLVWEAETAALTPRAKELLEHIGDPVQRIESALGTKAVFDPLRDGGQFRIAMSDRFAPTLVPRVFDAAEDRVSVEVVPERVGSMDERLESGEVGLWITAHDPEGDPNLASRPLYEEEWMVLYGADAPISSIQSLEGYVAAQHVGVSPKRFDPVDRALARIGQEREVPVRMPYVLAAVELAASTPLLCTVPATACPTLHRHSMLGSSPVPFDIPGALVRVVWHRSHERDPRLVWLREAITSSFELALEARRSADVGVAPPR